MKLFKTQREKKTEQTKDEATEDHGEEKEIYKFNVRA